MNSKGVAAATGLQLEAFIFAWVLMKMIVLASISAPESAWKMAMGITIPMDWIMLAATFYGAKQHPLYEFKEIRQRSTSAMLLSASLSTIVFGVSLFSLSTGHGLFAAIGLIISIAIASNETSRQHIGPESSKQYYPMPPQLFALPAMEGINIPRRLQQFLTGGLALLGYAYISVRVCTVAGPVGGIIFIGVILAGTIAHYVYPRKSQ